MNYSSYSVKVPGKLMIAGEYAVLEPNQKAVVVAVNRYVTACIKLSTQNNLSLPQLGLEDITWKISDERVQFNVSDSRLSFIQNAISVASRFLQEKPVLLRPFELQIKSELDDPLSGQKYGLGSSAAVVVAVISAILHLHSGGKEPLALDEIFKLSAIGHLKTQGSGSGADIAAAVYGGWLEYSAFSAKWILDKLEQGEKLTEIVEEAWPNLFISPLTPPSMLQLVVGWTKAAAVTAPMIKSVQKFRENNLEVYKEFLRESSMSVARLLQSFEINDCTEAINSLSQNRKALLKLGENADITIETEKLKTLCSIGETFGSSKPSGAGGGDCGIAFLNGDAETEKLFKAWKAADIIPLNLSVSKVGVSVNMISKDNEKLVF
jgi:phosphomevalonate kinase